MEANPLITAEQIRRIAKEHEMAVGVIEKDYAQSWLLRGFAENDEIGDSFLLKGGTATEDRSSIQKSLTDLAGLWTEGEPT